MQLEAAVRLFLDSLEAENRSPNTMRAYARDLKDFVAAAGPQRELAELQPGEIRAHFRLLLEKGLARASAVRKHAALKSFYRWASAEGHVPENILAGMPMRRRPRALPFVPSMSQTRLLLGRSLEAKVSIPHRARVVLELLYDCGLRISEVVALNVQDINLAGRVILVNGKGNKQRYVPFGNLLRQALEKYLPTKDKLQSGAARREPAALVVGREGRLTVRQVWRIVREAGEKMGLPRALHPHSLRHACATDMLNRGANLSAIQTLMGHERLTTTQSYAHISTARVLQVYKAAHPMERKGAA
ncbi:MAG: tyrosine-type recombinase/integrase [Terriglobales bacterium]